MSWGGKLSETAGLAFGFEQAEDVVDLDCWVGVVSLVFGFCAFFVLRWQFFPRDCHSIVCRFNLGSRSCPYPIFMTPSPVISSLLSLHSTLATQWPISRKSNTNRKRRNKTENRIPGPLTLRMMLREVSSMNSTRTWVTPPRDPILVSLSRSHFPQQGILHSPFPISGQKHTGTAEDTSDLDELSGLLVGGGIHLDVRTKRREGRDETTATITGDGRGEK